MIKHIRTLFPFVLLALLLAACTTTSLPTPGAKNPQPLELDPSGSFVVGQVIVGYEADSSAEAVAATIGATVLKDWHQINAAVLELPQGLTVAKAESLLRGAAGLRYSQPREVFSHDPLPTSGGATTQELTTQQGTIDDEQFGLQWQHRQLNSEAAWAQGITGEGIRIGIHDDFIDHRHPDLVDNMFYPGFDGFFETLILPDTPHDGGGTHGTSVAGKAAAAANALGGRGVAYNASIVPLAISNPGSGLLDTDAIVSAALFAVDGPDGNSPIFGPGEDTDSAPGANAYVHIVNMSWGSNGYSQLVKDTMDYMLLHGIVGVTSAGNTPTLSMASPAWYPGLVTVAATNPRDGRTEFSNRGKHIDVAAPGQNTWVTQTRSCILANPNGSLCDGSEADYRFFGGTSSASPATAGVAALVMEALAERDELGNIVAVPTPAQVRRILSETAFQPNGDDFNDNLGNGIVDAGAAVARALELDLDSAEDGASILVDTVLASDPSLGLSQVGLTLIPLGGDGPTKYTQTADGSFSFWPEGQALFLQVDAGEYLLLASGPHTATTGIEAGTGSVQLTLEEGAFVGVTIPLDVVTFEDPTEPSTDVGSAFPLAVGTSIRAALYSVTESTDVDFYAVDVVAGNSYWFNYETVSGSADALVEVFANDGTTLLAENDDYRATAGGDPLPDPALIFDAATTETVYIAVSAFDDSNSPSNIYDLDVSEFVGSETEPNGSGTPNAATINDPDFTGANPLALGGAINGVVDPANDVDMFEIGLESNNTYVIDLETEVNAAPDTVLVLFDAAGNKVAENDDYDGQDSRLVAEITTAGTYYIGVASFDQNSTGPYILSVLDQFVP
ncbi:MAG: S8 family serine peptidase [Trueperaceae bacterium]|nr:S8 family serine peptidase [Trueperaceae bacterium]